jgi:hypothetical protein
MVVASSNHIISLLKEFAVAARFISPLEELTIQLVASRCGALTFAAPLGKRGKVATSNGRVDAMQAVDGKKTSFAE